MQKYLRNDSPIKQNIELVPANKADIPILVEFLRELFSIEKDFQPDTQRQAAAIELILDNPRQATIYVITFNGEATGMLAIHFSISTAEGGWVGTLQDFYIKPQFRRQGVGKRVVEELTAIAATRGLKRLTLLADKDNTPALQFYNACGFKEMNLTAFIKRPVRQS